MFSLKEYSDRTQKEMKKLISSIKKSQGTITEDTEVSLRQLADNFDIYFMLMDDIKKRGVIQEGKDHTKTKNASLQPLNQVNTLISNILKSLGATPMSKSRMKIEVQEEDELDELID